MIKLKLISTADEIDAVLKASTHELDSFDLRQIDDRIWRWVNENNLNPAGKGWQYDLYQAPFYTTSIDDALTLRPVFDDLDGDGPKGADYILEYTNAGLAIACTVGSMNRDYCRFADNAAQAIVRACFQCHTRVPGSLPLHETPLRN